MLLLCSISSIRLTMLYDIPNTEKNSSYSRGPNIKTVFSGIGFCIIEILRTWDGLIFTMGSTVLVRQNLYIEAVLRWKMLLLDPLSQLGTPKNHNQIVIFNKISNVGWTRFLCYHFKFSLKSHTKIRWYVLLAPRKAQLLRFQFSIFLYESVSEWKLHNLCGN